VFIGEANVQLSVSLSSVEVVVEVRVCDLLIHTLLVLSALVGAQGVIITVFCMATAIVFFCFVCAFIANFYTIFVLIYKCFNVVSKHYYVSYVPLTF